MYMFSSNACKCVTYKHVQHKSFVMSSYLSVLASDTCD